MRRAKGLQVLIPGQTREYTPACCLDAPPDDRVVVVIKNPSEGDKRLAVGLAIDEGGRGASINKTLMRNHVIEVRNYEDSSGRPIKTGVELWEHGESEIVNDIGDEIWTGASMSPEGKKNSAGPLGSSSAEMNPSGSTAGSASPQGCNAPATATAPSPAGSSPS